MDQFLFLFSLRLVPFSRRWRRRNATNDIIIYIA
jgi:hypothetical protein